ncbi:MAG TPA: homoserine dehydrogenase [Gammaproteobacteria bacterium]|nr:homoserine dehydrogenase [Gammaproteobacteria bacterium]
MNSGICFATDLNVVVVKFGSSVLSKVEAIPEAIHAVYQYLRNGYKVLVVVSAIGDTTDYLINESKKLIGDENSALPPLEYAALLATGEISAAALFAIGLDRAGIKARKVDHRCLTTQGPILNADPISLDTTLINQLFAEYSVLVIPGFIGCDLASEVTLLGRGGSDYTAIFAGWALNAKKCVIYKDTPGIFDLDPNEYAPDAQHFECITFNDCLKTSYEVIQHKAVKFAQSKNFQFIVKSLTSVSQTLVGSETSIVALPSRRHPRKLKVALLGLGTVGLGVYKHLLANRQLFEVVGVAVKNIAKHQHHDTRPGLVSDNIDEILARESDVVVELIGGIAEPGKWIEAALRQGRNVVTANKALIAEQGLALSQLADENNAHLYYSAAVAGAVPILEILKHIKNKPENTVQSITGILNGTCNFVLEKIKEGKTFSEALHIAQLHGFAESDPSFDIEGLDAAQKATIISRFAFGRDPDSILVEGIQDVCENHLREQYAQGNIIKLIASCVLNDGKIQANIKPVALHYTHPLAAISGANNAIVIETGHQEAIHLHGKGAGRWPTAEAVFADLLTLSFNHQVDTVAVPSHRVSKGHHYEALDTVSTF